MQFLTCFEIDVAMYAAQAEHVLVLDVRAVAPAIDFNADEVLDARLDVFRHVELGIDIGSLRIAHLLAVHPDIGGAVDAVEVEVDFAAVPRGGHRDGAAVAAHSVGLVHHRVAVLTLDEGGQVLEWVGHVGVDGCAVALHLHARGHGYGLPRRGVVRSLVEVDGAVFGLRNPMELPSAVEHHPEGRVRPKPGLLVGSVALHLFLAGVEQHSGAARLLVDAEDGLVLPVILRLLCLADCIYLEVRLDEPPLEVLAGIGSLELPDVSAGLAVVVVAELQTACEARQDVCLGPALLDEPLLVMVSEVEVPAEHLALLRAVIAVVERQLAARAVKAVVALPVGLDEAPHLRLRFLVDGRECDGAVLVVESKAVANLQAVALFGVKVLCHKAKCAAEQRRE